MEQNFWLAEKLFLGRGDLNRYCWSWATCSILLKRGEIKWNFPISDEQYRPLVCSLRANPLAWSPGQVKLDSDKWKLLKNLF